MDPHRARPRRLLRGAPKVPTTVCRVIPKDHHTKDPHRDTLRDPHKDTLRDPPKDLIRDLIRDLLRDLTRGPLRDLLVPTVDLDRFPLVSTSMVLPVLVPTMDQAPIHQAPIRPVPIRLVPMASLSGPGCSSFLSLLAEDLHQATLCLPPATLLTEVPLLVTLPCT